MEELMLQATKSNPGTSKDTVRRIVFDMEDDIREALSCAWLLYDRLSQRGSMGGGTEGNAYCMIAGNLLCASQKNE
jgi:hypothetical protein